MWTLHEPKESSNEPRKWSCSEMQIPRKVSAVSLPPPSCLVYRGDTSAVTMMEKILANWQHTNQGSGRRKPILYTL